MSGQKRLKPGSWKSDTGLQVKTLQRYPQKRYESNFPRQLKTFILTRARSQTTTICWQPVSNRSMAQPQSKPSKSVQCRNKWRPWTESELMECRSERKRSIELLESIADRIAMDYQNGPFQKNQKANDNNGKVLPFSMSHEHLKRNPRPIDVFVCFFNAKAKLGCYSEKQTAKCKQDAEH